MYLAASAGYALLSYPLMSMMSSGTFAAAIAGGLAFAFVSSLFGCCMGATMVELFPTQTRYTGVAIGYNVGQAVLSGTAPLVAVALVEHTHHEIRARLLSHHLRCGGGFLFILDSGVAQQAAACSCR